jgi:uncharacterized protein YggE
VKLSTRAMVVLAATVITTLPASAQVVGSPTPQIIATGDGEASAIPDRATLYMGVQSKATTAAAAAADNARRQRAVLDTLHTLGLTATQISTLNYSVAPEMEYDRAGGTPRIVRYAVNNTVRVEITRLDDVGKIIDAALAKGANQISGLEFYSSNVDDARRHALAAAVTKARGDAEAIARAAGGSLGPLLELATGNSPVRPMDMMLKTADAMVQRAVPTPIEPGSQTVRASVVARWAFIGGR